MSYHCDQSLGQAGKARARPRLRVAHDYRIFQLSDLAYRKLALFMVWRKSAPRSSTTRHISCRRERIRSPIRSPRVSPAVARRARVNSVLAASAVWAGSLAKLVVMIVVRFWL